MQAGDKKDREGRQWEQRTELMRDAIIYNRNNRVFLFYECGNESISREHRCHAYSKGCFFLCPSGDVGRMGGYREAAYSYRWDTGTTKKMWLNRFMWYPVLKKVEFS